MSVDIIDFEVSINRSEEMAAAIQRIDNNNVNIDMVRSIDCNIKQNSYFGVDIKRVISDRVEF